jgi:cardiolipin synthase A/B
VKSQWRDGNQIELLINGEEFFPRLFSSIYNAKHEVIIETFIIFEDKVGIQLKKVLIDAAKRGVKVYVTADGYGSYELDKTYIQELVEAGVSFNLFDPQSWITRFRFNLFKRLHRKIVVIDRELAFVGGINYSDDHNTSFGPTAKQDYVLELSGPIVADVYKSTVALLLKGVSRAAHREYLKSTLPVANQRGNASALFVERDNWRHRNDIEMQYRIAIRFAKERVIIANAYFFPGLRFLMELRRAAKRGVDVTLILQGRPDMQWVTDLSRLLYGYLSEAGVNIVEYCERPLHGKVAVIDDEWLTVGSSNLDPLSMGLNLEANVIVKDKKLNQELTEHLDTMIRNHCKTQKVKRALKGNWWRLTVIFFSFHFLRLFPKLVNLMPSHSPTLKTFLNKKAQLAPLNAVAAADCTTSIEATAENSDKNTATPAGKLICAERELIDKQDGVR